MNDSYNDFTNQVISLSALIISIVALIMALLTYYTIDSVNTKSTLEGNVLENDSYTISLLSAIKEYIPYKSDVDIMEHIFEKQKLVLNKKIMTNIQLTDALQMMIDDYAILGWCNQNKQIYKDQSIEVVELSKKKFRKLRNYSNGTQYVLEENLKMIEYLYVQNFSREFLDNIRGDLFRNPYTRYLYFDSVGRQYFWEITNLGGVIRGCITMDDFKTMKNSHPTDHDKEKMELWLSKSLEAMNYANNMPIYNKPYTIFINNFIFRATLLQKIYLGYGDVEEAYKRNLDDWNIFIMQLNIGFNHIGKSYLLTSIFKSYYRLVLSYYAYCAVFETLPKSWISDMEVFKKQYYMPENLSPYEDLINLEPNIADFPEMQKLYSQR